MTASTTSDATGRTSTHEGGPVIHSRTTAGAPAVESSLRDGLRHQDLAVEALKKIDLFQQDRVVKRPAIGHDDHRLGKMPRSRCAARSSSRSAVA